MLYLLAVDCCECKIWCQTLHACYVPCIPEATVCCRDPREPCILLFSNVTIDWNFLHGVCVGQADNPGPWSLQLRNIVSASKHIEDFKFEADCHVWTETCATKHGQDKITKQIRKAGANVVFSFPAPSKSVNSPDLVGRPSATGSLCLSKARCTSLAGQWDGPVFSSGRVSDTLIQLPGIQVRIIAVYGFHSGIADSVARNDKLLGHVFHMAGSFRVPVLVVGDFNCNLTDLSSWQAAVARGFVDVAARQATLAGCEPEPTYKGTSRLDYITCNPLAARAFQVLSVDPRGYSDHASLLASFDWQMVQDRVPVWTFPRSFDSESAVLQGVTRQAVDPLLIRDFEAAIGAGNLDQALRLFAENFESKAALSYQQHHGRPLPSAYRGRTKGKVVCQELQRIHTSSPVGDIQVGCAHKQKAQVLQWISELCVITERRPRDAKRVQLWELLFNSRAFAPSFPGWLLDNDVVAFIPYDLPDLGWLCKVRDALQFEARLWQADHSKVQRANIQRCMQDDWQKGGRLHATAVKPVPLGTLDSLLSTQARTFLLLRAVKGSLAQIKFTDGLPTPPDSCLRIGEGDHTRIVRVLRDSTVGAVLNCTASSDLQSGVATQLSWNTETTFIANAVQDFWKRYWQPAVGFDVLNARILLQGVPQLPVFDALITPDEVAWVIRHLPMRKARGLDGFSNAEVRAFGEDEFRMLAALFNAIQDTGEWPSGLLSAFVSLLAKVPRPTSAKDGRPITILPTLYRIWGKIVSRKIFAAIVDHLPPDLFGSVPGRSALDAAWELQCQIEHALSSAEPIAGVSLDLSKAYNTIPRDFVQLLADRTGWPPQVTGAFMGYLNSFQRFFKIHGGLHAPTLSSTGVPEGCPIAVPVMILLTWAVTVHVTESLPRARMLSYVDNWTLVAPDTDVLGRQMERMLWATTTLTLLLNPDKTRAFATSSSMRSSLAQLRFAGYPLKVVHRHDDLGVFFTSTHQVSSVAIHNRLQENETKLRKLQLMPWSTSRKQHVLLRTIVPALLYGITFAATSATYLSTLRGRFSAVVWGPHHHRDHFLAPLLGLSSSHEPYLLVFRLRLADLRRALHRGRDAVCACWNAALGLSSSSGPLHYLHKFLRIVGIQPHPDVCVQFTDGSSLDLGYADRTCILRKVEQAWFLYAADKVSGKIGLEDVAATDLHWSLRLRRATRGSVPLLGSFTTNAAMCTRQKAKFLSTAASVCCHCGGDDTPRHRLFDCPHYSEVRQGLPIGAMRQWPSLLLERGLHKLPTAVQQWETYTQSLSCSPLAEIFDERVHLFTDGSRTAALPYLSRPGL